MAGLNLPTATDVLIVGAGPTGLALAVALQQAGIDHVVIEKLAEGLNTSRAGVIHAHTLEMLEELGVAESLVGRGLKIENFCIRDRDRSLLNLRFDALPSRHPYLLMLPQDVTEKVLSDRLIELGGKIARGVTASAVEQNEIEGSVAVRTPFGNQSIRARYIVGADGMSSIVRAAAGTAFEGGTYEESFVLADIRMDWPLRDEVSLFFSPAGLLVVAPLPNGTLRAVGTSSHAPECPGVDDIQALFDSRGPRESRNRVKEVLWSSRFRLHHRLVRNYRCGRFFLMGDAAHVHSPAGGQGMNTGLVDAVVLGRLLSRTIRDGAAGLLERYTELRRPAAERVIGLAERLTEAATMQGSVKIAVRNGILSTLNVLPPMRHRILMELSGLSRKKFSKIPG